MASDELKSLYPFLHGQVKDEQSTTDALAASIKQKVADGIAEKERFFNDNASELMAISRAIAAVYQNKQKMFAIGNGGSSCDAAHFAVEFQHPVTAGQLCQQFA